MAKTDSPTQALKKIQEQGYEIVAKGAFKLNADLVLAAPVDTGMFQMSYSLSKVSKTHWKITNNMEYASILWRGIRTIGGRTYGSDQWINGGDPMVAKASLEMDVKFKRIIE